MSRVFAISDLHLSTVTNKPMDVFGGNWDGYWEKIVADWNSKVTDDDIVIIAGDISWGMKLEEAKADLEAIHSLKGTKIIIKGNHDYWWSSYNKVKSILPASIKAIQNNSITINDYIFCGTRGWATELNSTAEDKKIYRRETIRLKMTLDNAMLSYSPQKKLVVMTHYPPFNAKFMDSEMTELIAQYPVKCVIYGHLHGKGGRSEQIIYKNDIPYYLTSCDKLNNQLVELPL